MDVLALNGPQYPPCSLLAPPPSSPPPHSCCTKEFPALWTHYWASASEMSRWIHFFYLSQTSVVFSSVPGGPGVFSANSRRPSESQNVDKDLSQGSFMHQPTPTRGWGLWKFWYENRNQFPRWSGLEVLLWRKKKKRKKEKLQICRWDGSVEIDRVMFIFSVLMKRAVLYTWALFLFSSLTLDGKVKCRHVGVLNTYENRRRCGIRLRLHFSTFPQHQTYKAGSLLISIWVTQWTQWSATVDSKETIETQRIANF